ncbi:unnamed protein product [Mytilus coruscus]|uniref:HAT C-terminal dimerisation domain-containing protein n=1 Tax=Mytilus coruscus TaxID=42192 RepID=A0A6J8AUN2_MYTCO|nr:unnamed protein product [Mytilus coruscus]
MAQFYYENIHNNLDLYPNIGRLYAIALTCPCTSIECERGFSQYNLIKTNHRNLLSVAHVNQLSIITIEGPPIHDFDFDEAFSKWVYKKERRSFNTMYLKEASRNVTVEKENEPQNSQSAEGNVGDNDAMIESQIERRISALSNIVYSLVGNKKVS